MMPICSVFPKIPRPRLTICWSCANDWSVYGFTRKILALTILLAFSAMLVPVFAPSQSNDVLAIEVQTLKERLNRYEDLPADIASIHVEIAALRKDFDQERRDREDTSKEQGALLRAIGTAIGGWVLTQIGKAVGFGVKFTRKGGTE